MLLSVVIPVYNVEKYLRECLDSVSSQDFDDLEVICVNDGSTDGSPEILAEYRKSRKNMIVVNRPNGGLSIARNSGLDKVTGKYVYFLDSDDFLLPGALKIMLDFAMNTDVEVVGFNVKTDAGLYYFKNDFNIDRCTGEDYLKIFYHHVGRYYNAPVWMYLYKADFIRRHGLTFAPGRLHEDNEFSGRALYLAESCAMHNVAVQIHRVNREGSITARISSKHYAHRLMNFRDLFRFYIRRPIKGPFIESLICQFLSVVSDSRKSNTGLKQAGFKITDFLKLALISPFYIAVLFRRRKRRNCGNKP